MSTWVWGNMPLQVLEQACPYGVFPASPRTATAAGSRWPALQLGRRRQHIVQTLPEDRLANKQGRQCGGMRLQSQPAAISCQHLQPLQGQLCQRQQSLSMLAS